MTARDSRIRAYLEILRLPNVFTAVADVVMGGWFVSQSILRPDLPAVRPVPFLLLIGASCCLYLSGMVLNDYFDRDQDARERPARPIPSRRIAESSALWLGSELLLFGVALAWAASAMIGSPRAGLVAVALAFAIVMYDRFLKKSLLGPVAMGTCRSLNVLLGMSAVTGPWEAVHYVVAGGLGLYIVGVTWFARTEAAVSQRSTLAAATWVMLSGLAVLATFPTFSDVATYVGGQLNLWYCFWGVLAAQIGWRCLRAAFAPAPAHVQMAVRNCLISLIVLDATITFAVQGQMRAMAVLLLLIPTLFLGRWLYST